jgi:Putative bacterial sensory transduction regulator
MQFTTPAQEICYNTVAVWMQELFGKFPCARQDIPGLGLFMGSALVEVLVFPWDEDDAIINVRSFVATDTKATPTLMQFLLEENAKMVFGAFGIDAMGDILFEYTILGSSFNKKELETSVKAVLEIADQYDDKIVEKWGGKRALERLQPA